MENSDKVVLGVIGADCHAVGNKILAHALRAAGFAVTISHGAMTCRFFMR